MKEARNVQGRVEALMGQTAPSDIDFPSANTVVVAKGEQVETSHLSRIQTIVNTRLSNLQSRNR